MKAGTAAEGGNRSDSLAKKNGNGSKRKHTVTQRNKPLRRFTRFLRVILPPILIIALIYGAFTNPVIFNILSVILTFAVQIAFILGLAILQFVGIFWFMAQTKVETIRPGDPKQITFRTIKASTIW
jgi:hypothetical protein